MPEVSAHSTTNQIQMSKFGHDVGSDEPPSMSQPARVYINEQAESRVLPWANNGFIYRSPGCND